MATVQIKNSLTNPIAAKRSRYEKSEVSYGKIPSTAYAVGDTLSFDHIPMKELIYAKFVGNGQTLEVFHGADISSALSFDIANSASTAAISYVVTYIRGTGKVKTSANEAGDGELLKITVASS